MDGSTWLRRFSSFEADHNRQARVRDGWLKAFQDLGFEPQFISSEEIEAGRLTSLGDAALVLPSSHALSDREAAEITPSYLDNRNPSRMLSSATACPARLMNTANCGNKALQSFSRLRRFGSCAGAVVFQQWQECSPPRSLAISPVTPPTASLRRTGNGPTGCGGSSNSLHPVIIRPPRSHARVHRFRAGTAELIAFERNVDYSDERRFETGRRQRSAGKAD